VLIHQKTFQQTSIKTSIKTLSAKKPAAETRGGREMMVKIKAAGVLPRQLIAEEISRSVGCRQAHPINSFENKHS